MNTAGYSKFKLDKRLEQDTLMLAELPLCRLLRMNDARYHWCILVPRIDDCVELLDLAPEQRHQLYAELEWVCDVLKQQQPEQKVNFGALGNVVRQFHWHVLLRHQDDPAWPGPVWGHSPAQPLSATEQQQQRLFWQQQFSLVEDFS